jgi:hypothetical protein
MRNRLPTKYQIGNVFESAKNIKELIELQVILNNKYIRYYCLIRIPDITYRIHKNFPKFKHFLLL